ncbi:MAG: small ribosomal subunit biogenesis GTPase RsgA [Gammaproteobacteria bacterium]|nr:small ribosomal subunit biogenesis GTPase RsgA [Gammaproteobacteria bacterium]
MPAKHTSPDPDPIETSHNNRPAQQANGLVIVNYGKALLVEDSDGDLQRCVARRNLGQIVSGDRVSWEHTGTGEGVISAVAPRSAVLRRLDITRKARPLAANIDQIVVVSAPQPALDEFLIDKYLIAAELIGTNPVLVINKSDLLDTDAREALDARVSNYADIGYRVLFTSVLADDGIDSLAEVLAGKTSILVGQSGVGKSSLIKRLLPDLDIAIGRLSAASGQGRHTTTATTLYHLPHGGNLIDSPGVRDFRLEPTQAAELAHGFREFRPFLGQCKFHNCRHVNEPECALSAAASRGEISKRRLENYRNLLQWMTEATP